MREEQLSLNFEDGDKKPPEVEAEKNEYHFAEKDECPRCGNPFEAEGSCVECRNNKKKLTYLESLHKKQTQ